MKTFVFLFLALLHRIGFSFSPLFFPPPPPSPTLVVLADSLDQSTSIAQHSVCGRVVGGRDALKDQEKRLPLSSLKECRGTTFRIHASTFSNASPLINWQRQSRNHLPKAIERRVELQHLLFGWDRSRGTAETSRSNLSPITTDARPFLRDFSPFPRMAGQRPNFHNFTGGELPDGGALRL